MSKLFQIYEDDLAELERILPQLADSTTLTQVQMPESAPRIKTMVRLCKRIISDVRWDYQPHSEIEIIPAGED